MPMRQSAMELRQRANVGESTGQGSMATERPARVRAIGQDIFVRYDSGMSGEVDKAAWRAFLSELLDEIPNRKKAPLARTLGIADKTLDRWLDPEWQGTVSYESVRSVAEKTG